MFDDHIATLGYLLRHKWYVFKAGRVVGVPLWRLIVHDASKFLPSEWSPYVHTFRNPDGSKKEYAETKEFLEAWNKHQKRNRHHWQWHVLTMDSGLIVPLKMGEDDVREMVADWIGANIAINGRDNFNVWAWYDANREKILLHPDSRALTERILDAMAILNIKNYL